MNDERTELNQTLDYQPTITVTAKWIVQNHNGIPDHACAECVEWSEILIHGFQCNYHKAQAALENTKIAHSEQTE